MMKSFRSQCLEKVNDRSNKFGPTELKEGCYPGLVLIVASLEVYILFFCDSCMHRIRVTFHLWMEIKITGLSMSFTPLFTILRYLVDLNCEPGVVNT